MPCRLRQRRSLGLCIGGTFAQSCNLGLVSSPHLACTSDIAGFTPLLDLIVHSRMTLDDLRLSGLPGRRTVGPNYACTLLRSKSRSSEASQKCERLLLAKPQRTRAGGRARKARASQLFQALLHFTCWSIGFVSLATACTAFLRHCCSGALPCHSRALQMQGKPLSPGKPFTSLSWRCCID